MGFPMARRLIDAGHRVLAFDLRQEVLDELVQVGGVAVAGPRQMADEVETIFVSLPVPKACLEVATGTDGVIHGSRICRFVDLSTTGSQMAQRIHSKLAQREIAMLDCPVSGGMGGAAEGTLAVMVSGSIEHAQAVAPLLDVLGRPFYLGEAAGSAQTMKLVNNMLSATALVATAEALVFGVKAGLDPAMMIDVINAGSGANSASKDKFPRAVLPRTFDYGFATGLMVKDLRLCIDEARALGLALDVSEAVEDQWELTLTRQGAESDFTCVIKPIEDAAGVRVGRDATN